MRANIKNLIRSARVVQPRTIIAAGLLALAAAVGLAQGPAASVNPMIGTGGDPDDGINLFPGATVPFGMVQLSPDTEDHGPGYHYIQARIKGFSMTHLSGAGCANEGEVFFVPTTGPIVTQTADFQSPYLHKEEYASPGYYRVKLLQWDVDAELTATQRTGVARFTYPAGKTANVLLPLNRMLNNSEGASVRIVGDRRIEGWVENHAFCTNKQTYRVYFAMTFDKPFTSFGTWTGDHYDSQGLVVEGSRAAEQRGHESWTGAYASWAASAQPQTITANVGISYVDVAGAEKNLAAEGAEFPAARRAAEAAWNRELSKIEIEGGTKERRRVFYTALYHSLMMPKIFEDVDGRYAGFDKQVHTVDAGHHIYADFSGWDVYRSEMPLLALIEPQRMQDMAQSIVLMYRQGGWIDRWPQNNLYTNDMIGSPLTIVLASAWLDGLHGFDIDGAWEGMLKDATQAPPAGKLYEGEDGVEWVNKLRYVPSDKVVYGSVAKTLEYAVAYASLARLAKDLGKTDEANMLRERAMSYRNVFDTETKFFRPRNADGTWVNGFNPEQDGHGFVEGSGWHYQTLAPADMAWLVKAVGKERFNAQLDDFFHYPAPGWYGQYYNPLNETDLQAPFAYYFSGEPWKSQRAVRRVLQESYTDSPDGVPGNDDLGAMSSWAVLSMMGIYSVDPASQAWELVGPSFPEIVVHLQAPYTGKSFTILSEASHASDAYIQSAQVNGKLQERNWISFHEMTAGGTVQFKMGPQPNMKWGAAERDAPPSLSEER